MSYVSQTLAENEDVVLRAHFNWTFHVAPTFWFLLGLAPLVVLAAGQNIKEVPFEELKIGYWMSFFSLFIGSILLLNHLIYLWTTEIVVTSFRFVFKTGLIARSTKEVSLNKLEEIQMEQSVLGRVFGYGKIILRGTGVGVIELPNLDNPVELRREIESAKARLRVSSMEEHMGMGD